MKVEILRVPDRQMPYDTVADWRHLGDTLLITYVDLGSEIYETLLWHHELDEAVLCGIKGIRVEQVDEFDKSYERKRQQHDDSEPGDQSEAPYHWAHTSAELGERALAASLGVIWGDYIRAIDKAFERVRETRKAA